MIATHGERVQPQESLPDIPQEEPPEEEPFDIELVVPDSPTTQDSPAEEQQQPKHHDIEDKANEEYPPSMSYPVLRKRERSLHTCAQDVQITRIVTI
jgi:hypothetical protein